MKVTKRIDLTLLEQELIAANVVIQGLGHSGTETDGEVFTYDGTESVDLPSDAVPVVNAHVAPPRVTEFAGSVAVNAIVRTTNATPLEVFRFPCELRHLYHANLKISGIDAGNFAVKLMEGRFVWKRISAAAIVSGVTVVSDIHDAAAASWLPNYAASGTDIVFTVQGAAGRTIDWLLAGDVDRFAPEGLSQE